MQYAETERHGIEQTYSADYAPARRGKFLGQNENLINKIISLLAPWLEEMLSKRLFDEQQNAQPPMPTFVHCCRCANGHAHCCCCVRQKSTENKMGEGTRATTTFQNTHPNACSCCKESATAQQRDMIVKQKQHKSQKPESILLVYRKYKLNQPESSV
jgi:hypothetical protein